MVSFLGSLVSESKDFCEETRWIREKVLCLLFGRKMKFSVWKSFVQDLLVQQGIDDAFAKQILHLCRLGNGYPSRRRRVLLGLSLQPKSCITTWRRQIPVCCWRFTSSVCFKVSYQQILFEVELYQLMKEEHAIMQDHISTFN